MLHHRTWERLVTCPLDHPDDRFATHMMLTPDMLPQLRSQPTNVSQISREMIAVATGA
ncbi:MAG TPA: hypothetical protein VFD92_24910 [Candidatus Binatia bacterium]|nr:hypothetical protein [Candidatus Binatia bacterium]